MISSTCKAKHLPLCFAISILFFAASHPVSARSSAAETIDPGAARVDTMVVKGIKESLGEYHRIPGKTDVIGKVLRDSPFRLIRRGSGAVSDLYADGLKRGDINVTIDGERFTTACPNRMDTRVGQVELLDIQAVDLSRNSATLQAGLGGHLDFRRRLPGYDRLIYGRLGGALDHSEEFDGSLAWEQNRYRVGGRYRSYQPYTDADGKAFSERYGYRDEIQTEILEYRMQMAYDQGDLAAAYESSSDVLFPYLLMDERTNDHYQLSGSYQGHRVYFNHTEHLMDNSLRTSYAMTDMVTDAKNTMFGAVGDFYEVYARHWDADNRITPVANPAMQKLNHMLPDVWRLGASVEHEFGPIDDPWLFVRAGVARTGIGDDDQEALYRRLEPDAETSSWSVPIGITAAHRWDLDAETLVGISGELSTDAPGIEQQFIATDKPGTKPDWIGNPELKDPARATLRGALQREFVQLEVFGTRVWNYPYLVKRSLAGAAYQTYTGTDALLAGANAFATWRGFEAGIQWNWGEKVEDQQPLAEIQPVTLHFAAEMNPYGPLTGRVIYQHSAGQGRIDQLLDEESTGAWNRVDLELAFERTEYQIVLSAENVTNVLYSQHLSYLRSPFSSGVRVLEPGRTIRVATAFGF